MSSGINQSDKQPANNCTPDIIMSSTVFPLLYSLLFIGSTILNCLALFISLRIKSTTTFIVYLKNVIAADVLMTVAIIIKVFADSGLGSLHLQAFVCRYSAVIFYLTMYMSIILLGLISFDRYLKIVKPFGKSAIRDPKFGKILTGSIWTVMFFTTALPNMVLTDQEPPKVKVLECSTMKGHFGLLWHKLVVYVCSAIFWLVFIMMIIFYTFISKKVYESYQNSSSKERDPSKKTTAKVFIVVFVFFFCFAPYHILRIPYTRWQAGAKANCMSQNAMYLAKQFTLWLSAANTCLDPLIYIILCTLFRNRLLKMIRRNRDNLYPLEGTLKGEDTSQQSGT
ncbi:P2Y purinoceptor 13-like [Erpetoichthys calabaricus]|uniref:P2Y purinoceptor 13-like n=1 Tax=Erpetoichthys calabaricus TaxID=27687 RepID=UPI002234B511|nr:P2Y purinoceptor 13-like [Erpetoichthys calabaricus]